MPFSYFFQTFFHAHDPFSSSRFLRNPETPPLPVELHHKHLFRFFVSFELDGKKRKENRETRLIRADCSPLAADLNLHKRRAAVSWRN